MLHQTVNANHLDWGCELLQTILEGTQLQPAMSAAGASEYLRRAEVRRQEAEEGMSRKGEVVRFSTLLIACFVLLPAVAVIAQTGAAKENPVTGKWGSDGLTFLELRFDGKSSVSGTTIWRDGTYEHRAAIKTGSFDTKTGVLKLEGEGRRPDGVAVEYVIEGKIERNTITGTFRFGDDAGEFTFKRQ